MLRTIIIAVLGLIILVFYFLFRDPDSSIFLSIVEQTLFKIECFFLSPGRLLFSMDFLYMESSVFWGVRVRTSIIWGLNWALPTLFHTVMLLTACYTTGLLVFAVWQSGSQGSSRSFHIHSDSYVFKILLKKKRKVVMLLTECLVLSSSVWHFTFLKSIIKCSEHYFTIFFCTE